MAADPKDKITPRPSSTALAAPVDHNPLGRALAEYDPKRYNLATPITVLDQVPPMHRVSIRVVQIDAEAETYPIPGGDKVGLGKTALDKIAAAAGINWLPERCGQIDSYSSPHRVKYRAVCTIQDFDGRRRTVFAEKEIDLRGEPDWPADKLGVDTREILRIAGGKVAFHMAIPNGTKASECRDCGSQVYWVKTPKGKNMPLDPDGGSHFATCSAKASLPAGWEQVYQQRSNIHSLAESKARLRCIRTAIGLPVSMTQEQASKPFVVPSLVPDLDTSDPEIKRMVAASLLGAEAALYGPQSHPTGAATPARDPVEPEPIDVSGFEDVTEPEPGPERQPEVEQEPDLPPADEPPTLPSGLPVTEKTLETVPVSDEQRYKHLDAVKRWCEHLEKKIGKEKSATIFAKLGTGFDPLAAPITEIQNMVKALKAELPGGGQ